jgi:hypothetical protein
LSPTADPRWRSFRRGAAIVLESAAEARCPVGSVVGRRVRVPNGRTERWQVEEDLGEEGFDAAAGPEVDAPAGTFVFVFSDFLGPVSLPTRRGLEVVPVVVQDPLWEQTFPDVGGAVLPLADPATGAVRRVRLRRGEASGHRRAHEERLRDLLLGFSAAGLDWVLLGSSEHAAVLASFQAWAEARRAGTRLRW